MKVAKHEINLNVIKMNSIAKRIPSLKIKTPVKKRVVGIKNLIAKIKIEMKMIETRDEKLDK